MRNYRAILAGLPPVTKSTSGDLLRTPEYQSAANYLRDLYLEFGRENVRREIASVEQPL